jgi:SAM-dependent methyltransferase
LLRIIFFFGKRKIFNKNNIYSLFRNKKIIEIGGPSRFFYKNIPIYQISKVVDGVNFSNETFWEGQIPKNSRYKYFKNKSGKQFIGEASYFKCEKKYDAVISSNCIEHIANPLKAVKFWISLLKPNGVLFLVAPRKYSNFDHNRDFTTFEHLLMDYQMDVGEDDQTHIKESVELHDYNHKSNRLNREDLINNFQNNIEHRMIHHHVFNLDLLKKISNFFSCKILLLGKNSKNYYILLKK